LKALKTGLGTPTTFALMNPKINRQRAVTAVETYKPSIVELMKIYGDKGTRPPRKYEAAIVHADI
jgi:hypothetical protein